MEPGHDIAGKYRMLRRLAGGGMGEVYLAAARGPAGFSKLTVIKRILPHFADDPDFVAMFLNEARLAAALDHPHIVRVYDFGEAQRSFFYVMEYLHGDSLATLLPRTPALPEKLPLAHALTIGLGVCAGLHFAHERRGPDGQPLGIVHRDVSPANVFLTCEGEVKILDFGIARAMATTGVTREGTRKGKAPYMSPEQCIGGALDRRSDVFSIGILLYEMTTLSRLFRADNEFATMNMITAGQIPPPSTRVPDYPPTLAAVVLRALHRDPNKRQASALELHEDLERVAEELGVRTSSLALGRYVRKLTEDRPYPSANDAGPDEVQTAVFFAAMNDALTANDGPLTPPPRPSEPSAAASGSTSAATVDSAIVPARNRRARAVLLAALTGGLLTAALVIPRAWSTSTAPTLAQPEPELATPTPATPALPDEPAPEPAAAPETTPATTPPPTTPPPRTRTTPRKRASEAPVKKPNVLDSLRPSK